MERRGARWIESLVRAGYGDRVMFGTDQLLWPGLMAVGMSVLNTLARSCQRTTRRLQSIL